ncbi:hypothetical protein MA16_Dca012409 [Dendrobium catenatum]|uniref:Uncharacterized protein n=1 Tax=Dendrobium catenatum TaxID=906689 RepID=A0A2I0WYA9_9ASPA|nr:hypothetical protein MA16_Dca012409 [Dendrobium catenatum]
MQPCEPKVSELSIELSVAEDIVCFDVSMNNNMFPFLMKVQKTSGDANYHRSTDNFKPLAPLKRLLRLVEYVFLEAIVWHVVTSRTQGGALLARGSSP